MDRMKMRLIYFGIVLLIVTHVSALGSLIPPVGKTKMISKIKAFCDLFPDVCKYKKSSKRFEVIMKTVGKSEIDLEIDVVEKGPHDRETILYRLKRVKLALLKRIKGRRQNIFE